MKIYSWNVLYDNRGFNGAFTWIEKLDFDILALQEVPETFLERLKTLPYYIAYEIDGDRILDTGINRIYLVILTRFEIRNQRSILLPNYSFPLRTRFFTRIMGFLGWTKVVNRHSFYVDVETSELQKPLRVFCLHLMLAYPALRKEEFERAMLHTDPVFPTIACGDFNILESPKITLLNWLLGGKISDVFHIKRERQVMEKRFSEKNVKNPLQAKITHPFSLSQLDHILVPINFEVIKTLVLSDSVGSDHRPIFVEINISN